MDRYKYRVALQRRGIFLAAPSFGLHASTGYRLHDRDHEHDCGSMTVVGDQTLNSSGRLLVFFGAASFYFSDLFVARDRFVKTEFANRLLGLPMYYLGQFLLAFSVGTVR